MRNRLHLSILAAAIALAACNASTSSSEPATVAQPEADTATALEAQDPAAASPEPATPLEITSVEQLQDPRTMVQMAASMSAMVEACGLGKPADRGQTIANLKRELGPKGMGAAQVEREFNATLTAVQAEATKIDPARMQRDCDGLRQLTDPETVRKLEQAAAEMEAWAKKMEAQQR